MANSEDPDEMPQNSTHAVFHPVLQSLLRYKQSTKTELHLDFKPFDMCPIHETRWKKSLVYEVLKSLPLQLHVGHWFLSRLYPSGHLCGQLIDMHDGWIGLDSNLVMFIGASVAL